jgi:superfamily I DNA/RNA helicase
LCGDPAQNIFGKKPLRWIDHGFKFKGRTSNINLSCNFRNTHEIFEFAWDFIKDDFASKNAENVQSEALSNPYANIEIKRRGPKPILRKYASDEEEREAVCREIRRIVIDEKVPPRMISILHPNATQRYAERIEPYISYLEGKKIPTYWLSKNDSNKINYDPRDNFVTVSTPESGKGLEWDIVFMPSIERYQTDDPNYLRFVAAIRAVNILYPSACGDYR